MFDFSSEELDTDGLRKRLCDPRAGALVTFEGVVRNHNDGRAVALLEYEAYETLARKEAENILQEALARFDIYDCLCVHRTGALKVGDVAVWVGALAAHRGEAFDACEFVIDEIKSRLPIFKKEYYENGDSGWVNCQHPAGHASKVEHTVGVHEVGAHEVRAHKGRDRKPVDKHQLYSRQLLLPEIGERGQQKLGAARVLVVGAGGLGSAALVYLAAAGVGTIGICEPDKVETSNLHRQTLFDFDDIGKSKAEVACAELLRKNPLVRTVVHRQALDRQNVHELVGAYDLVLDCTDNFKTKYALNDACITLGKALITAAVYQFEGQLSLITADGQGQCLRCLWTEEPDDGCVANCTEAGMLGAVVGVFGSMQAAEAIKVICDIETSLRDHVLFFNLLNWTGRLIRRKRNAECPLCGTGGIEFLPDRDSQIIREKLEASLEAQMSDTAKWQLDVLDLSGADLAHYQVIDIREPGEEPARHLWSLLRCDVRSMPLSEIDLNDPPLDKNEKYLFVCQKGIRSGGLVAKLRERGFANTYSLSGGIEAMRRKFIA